jgi:hypothetical protein
MHNQIHCTSTTVPSTSIKKLRAIGNQLVLTALYVRMPPLSNLALEGLEGSITLGKCSDPHQQFIGRQGAPSS